MLSFKLIYQSRAKSTFSMKMKLNINFSLVKCKLMVTITFESTIMELGTKFKDQSFHNKFSHPSFYSYHVFTITISYTYHQGLDKNPLSNQPYTEQEAEK